EGILGMLFPSPGFLGVRGVRGHNGNPNGWELSGPYVWAQGTPTLSSPTLRFNPSSNFYFCEFRPRSKVARDLLFSNVFGCEPYAVVGPARDTPQSRLSFRGRAQMTRTNWF